MENNNQESLFTKVFTKLLDFLKTKGATQENENEALAEFALQNEDDAEHNDNPDPLTKDDILEICSSIDHTNETIHKWYEQGKPDTTKFGVKEITELAKEINPDLSDDEIKKEIDKTVDAAIVNGARGIADEIAGEGNEITDEEMNEIEEQVKKEEE